MSTILTVRHLSGSLTGKSQRVALQEGQVLRLGRASENDIKFSDAADDSVSSMHAELSLQGGRLFIEDKRSSNGTFVNGAPCPPFQKVAVPDGSRIRLAKQGPEMQVTAEAAPAVAAAAPSVTATGNGVTAPQPKESVGRATMLREIDRARQEERDVMVGELVKSKKSTGLWVGVGLLLVLLLAGGGTGGLAWWNHQKSTRQKTDLENRLAQQQAAMEKEKNVWADVEKQVSPAVVHIRCLYRIRIPRRTSRIETSGDILLPDGVQGSGVLIRPGLILTAKHVVEPWKEKLGNWEELVTKYDAKAEYDVLDVQFPGQQPLNATLLASAEQVDLALIQIQPTALPAVPIIKSNSEVKVTDQIAAVGYPANLGQRLVPVKNFSGFGAEWTKITLVTPTFVVGTVTHPLNSSAGSNYVFFDATVTQGNSGGAVINKRGDLIGVVSQKFSVEAVGEILGIPFRYRKPVEAGNMAVSPDDIQAFLRSRGLS